MKAATTVLMHIVGEALQTTLTAKQYEYIVVHYEDVVRAIVRNDQSYRALYPVIRREALEYEYGFR